MYPAWSIPGSEILSVENTSILGDVLSFGIDRKHLKTSLGTLLPVLLFRGRKKGVKAGSVKN